MDKNTIIGFTLIGAIIIAFTWFNQPSEEQLAAQQRYQDSIALVQQQKQIETSIQEAQQSTQQPSTIDSSSVFFAQATGTEQVVVLKNELVELSLNSKGGRVEKALLKKYKDQARKDLVLFDKETASLDFAFDGKTENLHTQNVFFTPTAVSDSSVTMRLNVADGGHLDFIYRLLPNSYVLNMTVRAEGMNNVFPATTNSMKIDWKQKARHLEKGYTFEQRYTSLTYKPVNESFDYLSETKDENLVAEKPLNWVAFKNQYFSAVFIAEKAFNNAVLDSKIADEESGFMKQYSATMQAPFDPTGATASEFQFYFGPNHFKTLLATNDITVGGDQELEKLVYLGWPVIRWINRWFTIYLFDWLSSWGLNMGIVILLMTLIVKALVLPTTWKSFLSSAKMRALRPYINKINEKYPKQEDALQKQQATMALYKEYGVSPMGGCLPMLLQSPVLMAVFFFLPNAIELRQESFLWATDLSAYDDLIHWATPLPFIGNHLSIFCLLFSVATVVSQMITMKQQDTGANPQMQAMKWMMYIMPVMFFFIFNDYASGLSYYYLVSSLVSILTSWVMNRMTDEKKLLAQLEANKKDMSQQKPVGGSFMERLIALQKQQEEERKARQQQGKEK